MNQFITEIIKGICWAIPLGIGVYIGMYTGAKVLREKIVLHQTINIIDKRDHDKEEE